MSNDRRHPWALAPDTAVYCRRCDLYVGFGAAGVARPPTDRSYAWLASHCWICERSADEIAADAVTQGRTVL